MPDYESLEEKLAAADMDYKSAVAEFNFESSQTFQDVTKQMGEIPEHGPNHQEGNPLEHTQLVVSDIKRVAELKEFGFNDEDKKLLSAAAVLHDTGKATSLQYDVVTAKQNEKAGASEGQIMQAQETKLKILEEFTKNGFEISADKRQPPVDLEGLKEMSKGQLRKLIDNLPSELKKEFNTNLTRHCVDSFGTDEHNPALAANFRKHEKDSVEVSQQILEDGDIDIPEGQQEDLIYVVENHGALLDWNTMNLDNKGDWNKMVKIFADGDENGQIDERKLMLIAAHTIADKNSTINEQQKTPDEYLKGVLGKVGEFKEMFAENKKVKAEKAAVKAAEKAKPKMFQGPQIGQLNKGLRGLGLEKRVIGPIFGRLKGAGPDDDPSTLLAGLVEGEDLDKVLEVIKDIK